MNIWLFPFIFFSSLICTFFVHIMFVWCHFWSKAFMKCLWDNTALAWIVFSEDQDVIKRNRKYFEDTWTSRINSSDNSVDLTYRTIRWKCNLLIMSVFLHLFDVSNKITQCKKKRFYWVNHWRNEMQWQCGIRIRMFLGYHVHERTQCLVNVLNINLLPLVMLHVMYEQYDRPTKQHKQNI